MADAPVSNDDAARAMDLCEIFIRAAQKGNSGARIAISNARRAHSRAIDILSHIPEPVRGDLKERVRRMGNTIQELDRIQSEREFPNLRKVGSVDSSPAVHRANRQQVR